MFNICPNKRQQIIVHLEATYGIILSSLAFILPLLYIGSLRDPSSLPRYTLYGICSGIILSLVLFKKLAELKSPHFQKNLFFTVLALLSWAWFSLSWSIDPKNALLELIQLTGCIIIGFSISQLTNIRILSFIIISSIAGASIASTIGIAQYFNFNPLAYRQFSVPASTFTNPNIATTYIDLITPLAFVFIFIAKNKTYKSLATISSILCLSFLLLSHSRGSWLALVFVIVGLLFLINKNPNFKNTLYLQLAKHKSYLTIAIFIPFFLFFIPSNVSNLPVKTSQVTFDGSTKIRLHAYINSMAMLKDQPVIGTGYGGFKTGFRDYMFRIVPFSEVTEDKTYARLHNDLLQTFVELGVLGGLLFIYIYIILLQTCWRTIQKTNDSKIIFLMSGLFLAIIANGIHATVDFPFHKPTSALQFWIWLGIISALSIQKDLVKLITINRTTVIIFIILGSMFSFYNFNYYQAYINASKHRLIAENSINTGNCISARKNVDKMMDSFDADFRHQSLYVAVYSRCDIHNNEKLSAMNRVLNYDSSNTRARLTRANIFLNNKEFKRARADFNYLISILPHRPAAYLGLGDIATLNKDYSTARIYYEKAKELQPTNQKANFMLKQFKDNGI